MGIRQGKMVWLVLGILMSSGWLAGPAFATGTGNQADPFRVHELTYDVYFAAQGNEGSICINSYCLSSSGGNVKSRSNQPLQSGKNTVSIYSDWGQNDCCYSSCDKAVAVLRIGSDTDGNIIYTQKDGWLSSGEIIELNVSKCTDFADLPWTTQERCVNTARCRAGSIINNENDCCAISLSRTFYVSYCQCSAAGPCCDGCNYTSSGSNCGTGTCPYDSYYQASGSCYKTDYPDSCAKTCDGSGACQDCLCTPVNSQVGWPSCGACQEIDYSSCQGATGPMCKNSPGTTLCGTKDCSSNNGYVQYSSSCYYRTYSPCTQYCSDSGGCQDCACTSYSDSPQGWPSCGTCKEIDYSSCTAGTGPSCRNSAQGTACYTGTSQPGTCSSGYCVPRPVLSIPTVSLSQSSIRVGQTSMLYGIVTCSANADCGSVHVYPKANTGSEIKPLNQVSGLSVDCSNASKYETVNCAYKCPYMAAGTTCTPSWTITGNAAGTYPMFLVAVNLSGELAANSTTVTLNVSEIPTGAVYVGLSASPSPITAGSLTAVNASIYCSGAAEASCGNITAYLFYNGTRMGTTGNLFTYSGNPQAPSSCRLASGGSCSVAWNVSSANVGTYNLTVIADSDNLNVTNATKEFMLTVNSAPVGVIEIASLSLSTTQIFTGQAARLGASIACKSSAPSVPIVVPCGNVKAYAKQNGSKITSSGYLATPVPDRDCGSMYSSGAACPVYWDVTGNYPGTYVLDAFAYSDMQGVSNGTYQQSKPALNVIKDIGQLSVTQIRAEPPVINISGNSVVSATINCTRSYCGAVTASMSLDPGVSLVSANPQACTSFPCSLQWAVNAGSNNGTFKIMVIATSNETIPASYYTYLNVIDPGKPSLVVTLNMPGQARIGQAVQIRSGVACYTKDCGNVMANLKYRAVSGSWMMVSSGSVSLMPSHNNPLGFSLSAGQSREASWNVSFGEGKVYEIGIFAEGDAPANGQDAKNITVAASQMNMEILPLQRTEFRRGEDVLLRARITRDGEPVAGLSPTVISAPANIFSITLSPEGSGIYSGSVKVPKEAEGWYEIIFNSGESQDSTRIHVSPVLDVAARTDRDSYAWGESIAISGNVRRSGIETDAGVSVNLSCGEWNGQLNFNATGGYSYVYENRFMDPGTGCEMKLGITAQDSFGNTGYNATEARISAYEGELYSVSFGPGKSNYRRGENLTIRVKVDYAGVPHPGLGVVCSFLGEEIRLKETGGYYRSDYAIPGSARLGNHSLSCSVSGERPGAGTQAVGIEPMLLNISVVNPEPRGNVISLPSGEFTDLKLAVFYPDNTPVADALVQVRVGDRIVNLTYTGFGIYSASGVRFTKDEAVKIAQSTMFIQAQDSQGNYGNRSDIELVVGAGEFNWWWLLLVPAGIGLMLFAWYYIRSREPPKIQIQERIIRLPVRERVREVVYRPVRMPEPKEDPVTRLKSEMAELEGKSRELQSAKDLAEQQYYKRQIDEATFNSLMQKYEERLIEMDAAIRQKKKDLCQMSYE